MREARAAAVSGSTAMTGSWKCSRQRSSNSSRRCVSASARVCERILALPLYVLHRVLPPSSPSVSGGLCRSVSLPSCTHASLREFVGAFHRVSWPFPGTLTNTQSHTHTRPFRPRRIIVSSRPPQRG